jgi:glycosyltransferase involved in cell wall biosynthesis
MRILVYPHAMEIGGSQTNAIELAAAVRDLGHEVVVHCSDGVLVDRLPDLGLERVPKHHSRIQPGPATAADLRRVVRERGIDIVHGYEWPPILEAYAATTALRSTACVGTVMSMSVAPCIPASVPLVVGTRAIQTETQAVRGGPVHLIEPPVDTDANTPDLRPAPPATSTGLDPTALRLVIVSRLVPDLKLEGILSAVTAVATLAETRPAQLVIVGGGSAEEQVRAAAAAVNARAGRPVVVTAGESQDPRWAYASADICLGMGGSALRAMAFGKPLVVQGEDGFFELLDERSLPGFLTHGWYGRGPGSDTGPANLLAALKPVLDDPAARSRLGGFARRTVTERFSLTAAARVQEAVYEAALETAPAPLRTATEAVRSAAALTGYKLRRRAERLRGTSATDDFNARTRTAARSR